MLHLQLFADTLNTTGMYKTQIKETINAGSMIDLQKFYEKRLIDIAEPKLVHDQFGDKYPIPAGNGKTIQFRKYSSLDKATTAITEGVTPASSVLTVSSVEAAVNQYGNWIQLSDMLEMTAIDNNVVQATKLLGAQAGRTLDTITRDVLAASTNIMFAPKVAADGKKTEVHSREELDPTAKLTVDMIFKAKTELAVMNANPIDDSYVAIIHPYVAYDLMRSEEWIDVHKYANSTNIYEGEIGKIAGVRFVETAEAKIWNDDKCPLMAAANGSNPATYYSVFSTLILGANAFAVTEVAGGGLQHIVKQLGYGDDPLNQRSSCGWKATKAAAILNHDYMISIESCSSYSAEAKAN